MTIVLVTNYGKDPQVWQAELDKRVSGITVRGWPDCGEPDDVEAVLTDCPLPASVRFDLFPNLSWVHYLGHGAGDVLRDPSLAVQVPVTRFKRSSTAQSLTIYVVQTITSNHMRAAEYLDQQRNSRWRRLDSAPPGQIRVLVLGLGVIGVAIAQQLASLGYPVTGWSRTIHDIPTVRCVAGPEALTTELPDHDYVVGALPETDETVGLLGRKNLARMKTGAYLVNIGRGSLVDEEALVEALDCGKIAGATLDVFATEPLPENHPFWTDSRIVITPHHGGPATDDADELFDEIVSNYQRLKAGEPMINIADRLLGY